MAMVQCLNLSKLVLFAHFQGRFHATRCIHIRSFTPNYRLFESSHDTKYPVYETTARKDKKQNSKPGNRISLANAQVSQNESETTKVAVRGLTNESEHELFTKLETKISNAEKEKENNSVRQSVNESKLDDMNSLAQRQKKVSEANEEKVDHSLLKNNNNSASYESIAEKYTDDFEHLSLHIGISERSQTTYENYKQLRFLDRSRVHNYKHIIVQTAGDWNKNDADSLTQRSRETPSSPKQSLRAARFDKLKRKEWDLEAWSTDVLYRRAESDKTLLVVGTGCSRSPRGVLLRLMHSHYLFNCGETIGRNLLDMRFRDDRKIKLVCITHNSPENITGLKSLPKFSRSFAKHQKDKKCVVAGLNNYNVQQLQGAEEQSEHSLLETEYYYDPAIDIQFVQFEAKGEKVTAYICKPRIKQYDLEKLQKEHSVINEKCLKSLKNITFQIRPIVVVECPSEEFLPLITQNKRLLSAKPSLVVHFTESNMLNTQQYQDWLHRFGDDTKHLIVNKDSAGDTLHTAYTQQALLNRVHPRLFPQLPWPAQPQEEPDCKDENIVHAKPGLTVALCKLATTKDLASSLDWSELERLESVDFDSLMSVNAGLRDAMQNLQQTSGLSLQKATLPRITFLGTGSAKTSDSRNHSGYLVYYDEKKCMMFDAGEGTLQQLYRRFGDERTHQILRELQAVFISHLHLDHHYGVSSIVRKRWEILSEGGGTPEPLLIIMSGPKEDWLRFYLEYKFMRPEMLRIEDSSQFLDLDMDLRGVGNETKVHQATEEQLGVRVDTVPMEHKNWPYGIRLTLQNGIKLAYTGDTHPSYYVKVLARDCDLLIMEASYSDTHKADAFFTCHSTWSQAFQMGLNTEAKVVIMSHFNDRSYTNTLPYNRIPVKNLHGTGFALAYDFMEVRPCDFLELCKTNKVFQELNGQKPWRFSEERLVHMPEINTLQEYRHRLKTPLSEANIYRSSPRAEGRAFARRRDVFKHIRNE